MTKKLIILLLALLLLSAGQAFAEEPAPDPTPTETPAPEETEEVGEPAETAEPAETEAPACPPHDLVELYRTDATCISDGSVTRQCSRCGTMIVEVLPATGVHRWSDQGETHVCLDCGASAAHDFQESGAGHACTECGVYADHDFVSLGTRQHGCIQCSVVGDHDIPEGSHECSYCPYRTAHEYASENPHLCTICGQATAHDYSGEDPHVCTICGQTTEHDYSGEDPHVCTICGAVTEHDYSGEDPHVCTICGAVTEHDYSGEDPHVCTICGAVTAHDYSGEDPHVCTICGAVTEHDYSGEDPHVCTICGQTTEHDYSGEDPHVCTICGAVTEHDYSGEDPHVCTICGAVTEHDYSGEDPHVCTICGAVTEHDYSGEDPHVCTICGQTTEHDYSGEDPHVCTICGQATKHHFSEANPHVCTICGYQTAHEWIALETEDGGLYRPTRLSYRCAVCGYVLDKWKDAEGNPLDTDAAELAISAEDGALVFTESMGGQLVQAGRGMTVELTLDDPALCFAAPASGDILNGIGLTAEGGLDGLNVFIADARLIEDNCMQLTLIATEARMNQPMSDETGRILLSLPIADAQGASAGAVLTCVCGETTIQLEVAGQESASPDAAPSDFDDDLICGADGVTDYRIARDWVSLADSGRLWAVRLGSFVYTPLDGGEPETRELRPLIFNGRLAFE